MKKIGEVKKNWISSYRHKVGLARALLAGLSTGLVGPRQGLAGPRQAVLVLPRRLESEKKLAK